MTSWAKQMALYDFETDILVVGSGAAGMTAALKSSDCGLDVIIAEKAEKFGGTSALSGAVLWIPGSDKAVNMGHEDSVDEAVDYILTIAGNEDIDRDNIKAFVENAPDMLRYLEDQAAINYGPIGFPDYHAENRGGKNGNRSHDSIAFDGRALGSDLDNLLPSHPATMFLGFISWTAEDVGPLMTRQGGWMKSLARVLWRYYSDIGQRFQSSRPRFLTGGNALMGRLKLALDRKKIPLWLNSALNELIVENGEVRGAIITKNGQTLRIGARKGVILATGGFERSRDLRKKHLTGSEDIDWSAANLANTGDGILAALQAGAKVARMQNAWWAPVLKIPEENLARPLFVERALPGTIMVDRNGKRFTNEAASYHIVGKEMVRLNRDHSGAGAPYFIIFDSEFRARYPMGPIYPLIPDFLLSKKVRSIIRTAPTIEELALQIGLPPENLEQTIHRFNQFAYVGKDSDFQRGDRLYDNLFGDNRRGKIPNLGPLTLAPYYAVPVYPGDIGTCGGLVTDANGAVLSVSGDRIAGLYAAGNAAATIMGEGYAGGGATLGPSMTFAYLAAQHAASR